MQVPPVPIGLLLRLLDVHHPRLHRRTLHRRLQTDVFQTAVHGAQGEEGVSSDRGVRGGSHSSVPLAADGVVRGLPHMYRVAGTRGRVHHHLRVGGVAVEGGTRVRYCGAERVHH